MCIISQTAKRDNDLGSPTVRKNGCLHLPESVPIPVDIVDLFQRVERVPPFVDQAIEIGAKVVWMQLGIVHDEAAQKAQQAGLEVVMDRCMKIEYARLFGGLNTIGVNTGIISAQRPRVFNR